MNDSMPVLLDPRRAGDVSAIAAAGNANTRLPCELLVNLAALVRFQLTFAATVDTALDDFGYRRAVGEPRETTRIGSR